MSAPTHTTAARPFDFATASEALVDAAARAGACIMQHYAQGVVVERKRDASPVTEADRDAEAIILEALHRLAPSVSVVSEEAAADRTLPLPDRFFLVDPLDGTKEFINKRSDFTVNIALIEDGVPRFGLVYAPAKRLLALTPKEGLAVEAELEPSKAGARLAELSCRPLQARLPGGEGLVAVDGEEVVEGRLRRYYMLTEIGHHALALETHRWQANVEAANRVLAAHPLQGRLA